MGAISVKIEKPMQLSDKAIRLLELSGQQIALLFQFCQMYGRHIRFR